MATETGVSRTYSLIGYVTTCVQPQEMVCQRVKCLSSSLFGDFFIYGRVPKPGLRGQVATLLFAGSNPAAFSIMLRIV